MTRATRRSRSARATSTGRSRSDEHGRQKRYTNDVLGRLAKVEEFSWNGSVYSTTNYTYNALDQLMGVNQQGQTRSLEYDGRGRLWRRTTPEQGVSTYAYNQDDTLYSVTDARGAKTLYGYNGRHLVTSISYNLSGVLPGQNVAPTAPVTYTYDAAGHRTTMTDGLGSATYHYNNLSRMDCEYTPSLDRSYEYDSVGRLIISHSGAEARAAALGAPWGTMDGPYSQGYEYDLWGNMTHRYGWGGEVQGGSAGQTSDIYYAYAGNRRSGLSYDNAGNLTFDGGQRFTYDAANRQTSVDWTNLQQGYDGNGLRVSKSDASTSTVYYLRSSVLGGQAVAEIKYFTGVGWGWSRGYVYAGSQLIAAQQANSVNIVHEDPVTKSKRVLNTSGALQSTVETDPFGADTNRSSNAAFQPKKYTSYERAYNGTDEAMFRRYNRRHSRFDQPDPFEGSYVLTNPQSFNRYAYVNNDPANFVDPTGLWCTIYWTQYSDGSVEVRHVAGRVYSGRESGTARLL